MKKILSFLVAVLMLVTLASCSFFGLTVEQAEANLNDAGYEVHVIAGADFNEDECPINVGTMLSSEIDYYLWAKKGDDEIYLFFFPDSERASDALMTMSHKTFKSGSNSGTVYFGTKQAIKDSKI